MHAHSTRTHASIGGLIAAMHMLISFVCSNRFITRYQQADVVLLAARDMRTLEELDVRVMAVSEKTSSLCVPTQRMRTHTLFLQGMHSYCMHAKRIHSNTKAKFFPGITWLARCQTHLTSGKLIIISILSFLVIFYLLLKIYFIGQCWHRGSACSGQHLESV